MKWVCGVGWAKESLVDMVNASFDTNLWDTANDLRSSRLRLCMRAESSVLDVHVSTQPTLMQRLLNDEPFHTFRTDTSCLHRQRSSNCVGYLLKGTD